MLRKRRTRAHIIADLGINHVERRVLLCGFVAERRFYDYGYDLVLYTYRANGEAENGEIFIQVKATDTLPALMDDRRIPFVVAEADLALWLREPMPVILVLYDALNDEAYWIYVQAYFAHHQPLSLVRRTRTLYFDRDARLDAEAIRAIARHRDAILAQVQEVRHGR